MKKRELLSSIVVRISIIITPSSLFPGAQTYCFLLCTARLRRLQPSSSHLTYKGTFTIHITIVAIVMTVTLFSIIDTVSICQKGTFQKIIGKIKYASG